MNYQIKNDYLTVEISSFGGELKSILTNDGTQLLWQGNSHTWEEQAPNLFPYIARLTNGTYTYRGVEYQMQIHGFVKYMELSVVQKEEDEIVFCLESNQETKKQYPFAFCYLLHYKLQENSLKVHYKVHNKDTKEMIFGIGGHPGFCVPWEKGTRFEDYYLEFEHTCRPKRIGFTKDCYVDGSVDTYQLTEEKYIPLSHGMFDQDAIVIKEMCNTISIKSDKTNRSIRVSYPGFRYLGLWHWPKSEAEYICIEPWSSLPSRKDIVEDLETQEDLIHLPAQEQYNISFRIECCLS